MNHFEDQAFAALTALSSHHKDPELAQYEKNMQLIAELLRTISTIDWISSNPEVDRILNQLYKCTTPVEIDEIMDQLLPEIGRVIAERSGKYDELHHLTAAAGPRKRSAPMQPHHLAEADINDSEPMLELSRTFVKL